MIRGLDPKQTIVDDVTAFGAKFEAAARREPLSNDPILRGLQANEFELDFAKVGKALKQPKTDRARKSARRREKLARRRNR